MKTTQKIDILSQYDPQTVEEKWLAEWERSGIYHWDPTRAREETFVVDTPPPTVSGSLHVGHVFSYTHTDIFVRYQRMRGKNIMYPMGWDDNGLPTERRVQNVFGIDCNPILPYNTEWKPVAQSGKETKREEVSRRNFIEACDLLTRQDEKAFAKLWHQLGLSIDWRQEFNTIGKYSRHVSQLSFLDLVQKGVVYHVESPTIWDVTFKTAVAQAELEDRQISGLFHDIRFAIKGGGDFIISTTRPELLPACIAVVAHPDDSRYQALFGQEAITPLFGVPIPILPSTHADPEKGSGIMMVCTFGDSADLAWWKSSSLPLRMIVGRDGRLQSVVFGTEAFPSQDPIRAQTAYDQLVGKFTVQARKIIAELLAETGSGFDNENPVLQGIPKAIEHAVKFYEKGERPVEFVASRQWYVRLLDFRQIWIEQGQKIEWHPAHMRSRYENWVNGLNQDWCISRQRFFGVPFPVWYPVGDDGTVTFEKPIFADAQALPVDPLSEPPIGYTEDQRGQPGGFVGDPDVMDTWATSSLTPQIVSGWGIEEPRHAKLFPTDLRPQSHEIIRTWAFYTIVKSWFHNREVPWSHISISGWILDPDRKKMSKSKGNTVTPQHLLEKYSSDAVRYWAARARLGVDTTFDEKIFESGRKLSNKIFNASRFVLMQVESLDTNAEDFTLADVTHPLDVAWLRRMQETAAHASANFEQMDHAGALAATEATFWDFCDNYVELVKLRAYQGVSEERKSARASLSSSLGIFLRLFAPFMPYVTEEIWSIGLWRDQKNASVHTAPWPTTQKLPANLQSASTRAYNLATEILSQVRKVKGEAKKGAKCPVEILDVRCSQSDINMLQSVSADIERTTSTLPGAFRLKADATVIEGHPSALVTLAMEMTKTE